MSILNVEHLTHGFGDRALKEYKGTVIMVCHEPDFYQDLATDVLDCTKWTTKLI